jgi:hypothetical protein
VRRIGGLAAIVLIFVVGADGSAQVREQRAIDDIILKAERGDNELGFCSTTGWPPGDEMAGYESYLRAARVGSWKVSTYAKACSYDRVTQVHQENGGKCVTYTFWVCNRDGNCAVGHSVACLDPAGKFKARRRAD